MPTALLVLVAGLTTVALAGTAYGLAHRHDPGVTGVALAGFLWFLAGVTVTTAVTAAGVVMMATGVAEIVYAYRIRSASGRDQQDEQTGEQDDEPPICPGYPRWSEGSPYLRFPAAFHRNHNRRG